ncbi:FAD-dependent oxidoreductase [Lentzea sp. CC55]|uniref:NAD(P)/FAD-dependent oxidoreductase n=1 Tax=Lentzea sp. CC55 TaxID=2884909 RepID=UPI0027E00536|nr:FAD-dependent oxidoreductase [Lentzea sp. CC55]MCG8927417.1 FAD-dependent oxidoreductase [Lentzea sp. CC55]
MSTGHLLVIGAGQAGAQLVSSARELGWAGPITLVGHEPHAPYGRPPLSKAYLRGEIDAGALALRSNAFYTQQRIDLVVGERVAQVDLAGREAVAESGRRWTFDRLALATGAEPRRLELEGSELEGVVVLRDVTDAEALTRRLTAVADLVVIGGGFIGLEVAATAAASGVRATVVEAGASLMNRVLSPDTAAVVEAAHRAAGVRILTGARPLRLRGDHAVRAVELDDGTELPAGLVLVGVGARPRDDLARGAGLHCDGGVVVDELSLASDGRTVAVGDCANLPDPTPGVQPGRRLRLESVDNATEQAKAAASTLTGNPRPYRSVPWFWSDQGALKLQIAGLAGPDDDVVVREGTRAGQHVVLRYRGERLVAVECVNAPADFLVVRKALTQGTSLPCEVAAEPGTPLKKYLAG